MDSRYGVDVQNRFALMNLDDDDLENPDDILKASQTISEVKKGAALELNKPKIPKQKTPFTVSSATSVSNVKDRKSLGGRGDQVERQGRANTQDEGSPNLGWTKAPGHSQRQGRNTGPSAKQPPAPRSGSVEDANRKNEQFFPDSGGSEIMPRRGGRGGPRLSRGGTRGRSGTFDQRGKREFDRLSGRVKSGVKPVDKREGGGAHNWGTPATEIEFPDPEERSSDDGLPPGDTKDEESPEKAKADDVMTLDEWKQKEQAKRSVPTYNLRKPGEGGETDKWGKTYVLKKKETDGDEEDEYEDDDETIKRGRQKQHVDIEVVFSDTPFGVMGARGGGASRRGRGRMNRGSSRGSSAAVAQPHSQAPKVDNFEEFPSL